MKLMNAAGIIACAAAFIFTPLNQQANAQCLADVNHDHSVDGTDLTAILSTWGTNGGSAGGDISGDGTVNGIDLAFVLSGWGVCPSQTWATVLEWSPNPAVVTDANLRAAIVASGFAWRVRDNSSSIEMLLVPAGNFMMGCSPEDIECGTDESPAHQVTLTNAFYMGKTEVTQAQWQAKMGSNPSAFQGASYPDAANRPVERVSWYTIQNFNTATGLRLPTEAEWEYACRAGTTTARYDELNAIAWYYQNWTNYGTQPVAGKLPNALGLYDTLGNVWEWCQDWYGPYSSESVKNPTGPATGSYRLLCGGAWLNNSPNCRGSQRNYNNPAVSGTGYGFRVARTADIIYISSVTPNSGATAGGTAITITGANLTGAISVTVGGIAATSVVVVSSTSITAVTPAGTAGAKSVAVTTPNETATATNAFTYFAPPTISSVSPATGSTAGGIAITITGANLTGATSVTVGGVAATSVVVVSAMSIIAVTPAGTAGANSVAVTTPGGSATSAFTYVVPTDGYTVLEQYVDPAVVTNVTMRNAITASGLPWRVQDNGTNIEMLLVPAGTFTMGCSASTQLACVSDESPTHQVTLTQAFYMGRYEVTQAQWTAKMGSNPSFFPGFSDSPSRPVERVSWDMIASTGGFMSVTGLRLPTEAEWEYAYRAGTTTAFHSYPAQPNGFNDDILLVGNIAWYSSNSGNQTHAVGGKFANGLGLHDMAGNVWEWCQDWYGPYSLVSVTNPTGPATGSSRLLRGGGWSHYSGTCRASQRAYSTPDYVGSIVGFRVARNP